ncbi:MAG: hypothetical protein ABJC62_10260 [Frankiaceae bacterium]
MTGCAPDREGARPARHGGPERIPATSDRDAQLVWIGPDDRGVWLEVVAVDLPDTLLVIHVMPQYRR